jgi:ABC-type branched-subunit amino acid transport system substrate-binding protein
MKLLAILFAFALIAAGCGDDDAQPAAEEPAAEEPAAEEPAAEEPAAEEPAGLTVPDNPDNGVTSDEIKVGWMGDLTGPTASSQAFNSHGTEAYIECLNERGGLLGREVVYLPEDDQFSPENAAVNFTKLTEDDKILALLGQGHSGISTQLQPDTTRLSLAVIGAGQTIDVQLAEDSTWFNNLAHYGDQADIAAGQIGGDVGGLENAVVMGISLEVPSGSEYAAYVEQSITNGGGTYVDTLFVAPGATEVTAQMIQLQGAIDDQGVNYVTLHASPGAALVVMQGMSDAGITDIPIIGIHGVAANSVWTEGPADVTDQVFGAHSFLSANNETEASADMTRCAELAGYAGEELTNNFAHGYLNGYIFEQAVLRAAETGELSRESFVEALRGKFDTLGITCPIDWTNEQRHSPCGAAFSLDPVSGGMVAANPFDFYADQFDREYGIDF